MLTRTRSGRRTRTWTSIRLCLSAAGSSLVRIRIPGLWPGPAALALPGFAATARNYGLTLVTRNVTDFQGAGVALVNPWSEA